MPQVNFFKNLACLDEGSASELTSTQSQELERLAQRIKDLSDNSKGKILALVGKFGSGKSTVIDKLQKSDKLKQYSWVNFDIWRYADRQQIWDGFVIEAVAQINSKSLMSTASDIEGWNLFKDKISKPKNLFFYSMTVFVLWFLFAYAAWIVGNSLTANSMPFFESLLKYGTGVLLSVFVLAGISSFIVDKRPLKRIFQLETKLAESVRRHRKPIIIVIEDVDRAGEEGVVFMETLKKFFDNNSSNTVVVLAPQSDLYIKPNEENSLQGLERGIKVYDSVMYFAGSNMTADQAMSLIKDAEISKKYIDQREQFESTAEKLLTAYASTISMRTLKFILRELNEFVVAYPKSNPSIVLTLLLSNYIFVHAGSNQGRLIASTQFIQDRQISTSHGPQVGVFVDALCNLVELHSGSVFTNFKYGNLDAEIEGSSRNSTTDITLDIKYKGIVRS